MNQLVNSLALGTEKKLEGKDKVEELVGFKHMVAPRAIKVCIGCSLERGVCRFSNS